MTALALARRLRRRYPELSDLVIADLGDHLYLNHIEVKPEARGRGIGRRVVAEIQAYARRVGKPLALVRDPRGDDAKLNRFYRGLGFHGHRGSMKFHHASKTMVSEAEERIDTIFELKVGDLVKLVNLHGLGRCHSDDGHESEQNPLWNGKWGCLGDIVFFSYRKPRLDTLCISVRWNNGEINWYDPGNLELATRDDILQAAKDQLQR